MIKVELGITMGVVLIDTSLSTTRLVEIFHNWVRIEGMTNLDDALTHFSGSELLEVFAEDLGVSARQLAGMREALQWS